MQPFGTPFEFAVGPAPGTAVAAAVMMGVGALALSQSAVFLPAFPLWVLSTVGLVSVLVDVRETKLRRVGELQWQQVDRARIQPVELQGNFFTPWLVLVTVTSARRQRRLLLWRRGQDRWFRHVAAALAQDETASATRM